MLHKDVDLIIVGQGLAGTILAHELLARGKSILIIDQPSLSACSKISAGMYNPVVFKRLTQSWIVDELLETLVPFYKKLEEQFGEQLLFKKEIVKIFAEEQERSLWNKKRGEAVGKYLLPVSDEKLPVAVDTSFGHGSVTEAGYLNVQRFLQLSKEYFKSQGMLLEEKFEYAAIEFKEGAVTHGKSTASTIIFCEGYRGSENPYFKWIPFNPAKGELLTVRIKNYTYEKVINKSIFIAPLGNDLYRVGSTFAWENINDETSDAAKEKLIADLKKIITQEFEIIDHKAGVRPAVDDRRPVIGLHPEHKQLGIFNGMGSKGVMLAPYFAKEFCDHLYEGKALNKEADIARLLRK